MSMKPLLAYEVQEEDEGTGGVVFARTNREARKAGSSEFGDGNPDWGKARRIRWADQFAPGPVPKIEMVNHGWWFSCQGCDCKVSADMSDDDVDETNEPVVRAPVEHGDAIFCSASCRDAYLVNESAREAVQSAALDSLNAMARATYPNIHIHHKHAYAEKIDGSFVATQAIIRFKFPGCRYYGAEMRIEKGSGVRTSVANGDAVAWKAWTSAGCPAEMPVITTAERLVAPAEETASQRHDRLMPVYLERNNLVAAAYGIEAAVRTIREHYAAKKRAVPKWLEEQLASIDDRIVPIRDELIVHRAEVEPDHTETHRHINEHNSQAATQHPH